MRPLQYMININGTEGNCIPQHTGDSYLYIMNLEWHESYEKRHAFLEWSSDVEWFGICNMDPFTFQVVNHLTLTATVWHGELVITDISAVPSSWIIGLQLHIQDIWSFMFCLFPSGNAMYKVVDSGPHSAYGSVSSLLFPFIHHRPSRTAVKIIRLYWVQILIPIAGRGIRK